MSVGRLRVPHIYNNQRHKRGLEISNEITNAQARGNLKRTKKCQRILVKRIGKDTPI